MKEYFRNHNFRYSTQLIIDQANLIIEEYQTEGYDLTLRQLYYQFVARDIIPNNQKEYNKLGNTINNARLAGQIDWDAIKDRTRSMNRNSHWDNPSDIISSAAAGFALDSRADQDAYIEVWVEKEALAGVVGKVCGEIDIPWFACRGYVSQSAMYEAAWRFRFKVKESKFAIIFHLGDHDPSGIDMTRDIQERLEMFEVSVDVKRIALNMDQVEEYRPPSNPAKMTDSRFRGYIKDYGSKSWELDALDPTTLSNLIQEHVALYSDPKKISKILRKQQTEKKLLVNIAENLPKIIKLLNK